MKITADRPGSMSLEIDGDVRAVAQFMMQNVATARLVAVARSVSDLAPMLWGHYTSEDVSGLRLVLGPISACDPQTRSDASV